MASVKVGHFGECVQKVVNISALLRDYNTTSSPVQVGESLLSIPPSNLFSPYSNSAAYCEDGNGILRSHPSSFSASSRNFRKYDFSCWLSSSDKEDIILWMDSRFIN